MKESEFFVKVSRENPKDERSVNARLLIRGCFAYKELAGAYTYLPLGLRVLRKIENIIREELEKIGGQEMLMTVFQPKRLWEETGRWDKGIGKVMYKCEEDGEVLGLGPTHEEMVTDIARHYVSSYKDLPLYLYQIQTKFRKELRAKSGLLRGREFEMKDLYSFHASAEDLKQYYQKAIGAYLKIFKRCGLEAVLTEASGGDFTTDYTHEFQVIASGGEDTIVYCPKGDFSQNKEIALEILRAKLYEHSRDQQMSQLSSDRRQQIGTADRSEKIRTYNYPQNRITDHRINKSWHDLETIVNGKMEAIIKAFRKQ